MYFTIFDQKRDQIDQIYVV